MISPDCDNEQFLTLHQEHQSTQAKSSHKPSSRDMQAGLCLPCQCHWLHRMAFPSGHWWQLGYEPLVGCYRCEPHFEMKWNGKANVEVCLELRGCLSCGVLCWGGMCQFFFSLGKDVWHSVNLWCWHICYSDGQLFFCQTLVNPQRRVFSLFTCNLDLSQVRLIAIHPPWPHVSMPEDFPCAHPGCHHTFKCWNTGTQHYNAHHHPLSPDSEPDPAHQFHIKYYLKLNGTVCIQFILWKMPCSFHLIALPCNQDGKFLHQHAWPPPPAAPDATEDNAYHPFKDWLAFDWAHYHVTELQSSAWEINKGLDLWLASNLKAVQDTPLPSSSVEEMYQTINAIQEGDTPFETIQFKTVGPICPNTPAWMTATYELCTWNPQTLLHHQLATTEFADTFDPRPSRQFKHAGDCVWSNLMSGNFVWNEAVRI